MDPRFFRQYLDRLDEDGIPVLTGDPNAPQTFCKFCNFINTYTRF